MTAHRPSSFLALAAGAALAAGCATAEREDGAAPAGRQCFLASQVNGFHPVDDDTVHVMVGASQVYELDIVGTCPEVDWSHRIGIRATGGGNWVCSGFDAELIVPSSIGPGRCPVTNVRRLTEDEARAIRERH